MLVPSVSLRHHSIFYVWMVNTLYWQFHIFENPKQNHEKQHNIDEKHNFFCLFFALFHSVQFLYYIQNIVSWAIYWRQTTIHYKHKHKIKGHDHESCAFLQCFLIRGIILLVPTNIELLLYGYIDLVHMDKIYNTAVTTTTKSGHIT